MGSGSQSSKSEPSPQSGCRRHRWGRTASASAGPDLTVPLSDPQNCRLSRSLLENLDFHQLPRARVPPARACTLSSTGGAVTMPSLGGPASCVASPIAPAAALASFLAQRQARMVPSLSYCQGTRSEGWPRPSKGVIGDVQTGVEGGGIFQSTT